MFRLKSVDEDTNVETHWTVGETDEEQLGGLQTLASMQENVRANAIQFLFRQHGKKFYNATKTRALKLCPIKRKCVWTKDLGQASDFNFVQHSAKEPNKVWLVAEQDRMVMQKNGEFGPYYDPSKHLIFVKEDVPILAPLATTGSSNTTAAATVVSTSDPQKWGSWIYIMLVIFIILLLYYIYLLDLATCVFAPGYCPKVEPDICCQEPNLF